MTAATVPAPVRNPVDHTSPVVTVRNLRVDYGTHTVLDGGVDLDLHAGETVALLGASGSGKSTLMKSLTGFAPVAGGSVRVVGHDVTALRNREQRRLRAEVGRCSSSST